MSDAQTGSEALRDCPGFARFWTAATVSGFGTYITTLAVQVLVVETLHEGSFGVGLVNASRWLPYLLFGVVAGVLVDRSRRRPILVATDLARGALLAGIPVLALTDHLTLAVLMAFMSVFGLMSLFGDAAAQSFLPRLVPRRLLAPANARLDQSDAVAQTSGPALAGGLVSLLTAPWAVLVDAVTYLVSGLLLLRLPVDEQPSRRSTVRGVRGEAMEGLHWVYGHRMLRPQALGTHAWFVCSSVAGAVMAPFALLTLDLSAFGLGVALAVGGAGGLLGALVATPLGARFGAGRVVIASTAVTGVAWAVMALSSESWPGWVVFGTGQLLLGLSMGASNANEMAYRQTTTPDHLQGRTNASIRSINRAMVVVGAPVGGVLGDALGFRTMLWGAAAGFLVVAAAMALTPFRGATLSAGPDPAGPDPAGLHLGEAPGER